MTFSDQEFAALADEVSGPVLRRGDEGVAAEVAAQNTEVIHDPDIVVGAATEADVAAAVRFALDHDLLARVLATGHGAYVAATDGMLITTSRLSDLTIDPETAIAHIGAGNRWSTVVAAAAEHGLHPITGASGNVGTVGYLLGGGLGPLARTFGFSSDWVRGFRVVTGTGELVSATADENPELFWALRGGKGGLGLVTSVQLQLVPLETFYGGSLFFDTEHIAAVLRGWAAWTADAPESATTSVAIIRFPPLDVIPEPMRGKTLLTLRFVNIGEPAEGERLFQPLRDLAPALLGRVGEMPAGEVSTVHNDPTDAGPSWDRGAMLRGIDSAFVDAFLEVLGPDQRVPIIAAELRHLGGATSRDVPEGSAVGGRSAAYSLVLIGVPDVTLFGEVLPGIADGIKARLAPWISPETNINFAGDLSVPGSLEAAWPAATRERLAEVRAAYDPSGTFVYPR